MTLHLPAQLDSYRERLTEALQTPVLGDWPDETAYVEAFQPAAIGRALIAALGCHGHLTTARIAYLFREDMQRGGQTKLGTASKAAAKVQFLTDYDFVTEFNWSAWRELTAEQRIALVDHELCHCTISGETAKFAIRPHDVEEFGEIVRRWGLWKPDLEGFGKDVHRALAQTDLFAPAGAEA